uniref:Ig-like domain-containing protein n=1 Tax=Canis lupus familiaris TaxID=9615 RepID=A0A8C0PBB9_CANLF
MPLLEAVIFSSLWTFGLGQVRLEQPQISISGTKYKSINILCKLHAQNFNTKVIHWYRQKPEQDIEHLTWVQTSASKVPSLDGRKNKLEASKNALTSTSTLKINFLQEEDEAMYYCSCWSRIHSIRVDKRSCIRTIFRSDPLTSFSTWATTAVYPA